MAAMLPAWPRGTLSKFSNFYQKQHEYSKIFTASAEGEAGLQFHINLGFEKFGNYEKEINFWERNLRVIRLQWMMYCYW